MANSEDDIWLVANEALCLKRKTECRVINFEPQLKVLNREDYLGRSSKSQRFTLTR
jgi:hypothetical protein